MAREYFVEMVDVSNANGDLVVQVPEISVCYNAPGLSWRDAKKQLRAWYLAEAHKVRALREKDVHVSN